MHTGPTTATTLMSDRGARGFLRYLLLLPHMWRSDINREVVRSVAPVSGDCVVDLGAGMGAATVEAAISGARVVAVDPMPYMRRMLALRRQWQRHRGPSASSMGLRSRSPWRMPAWTPCGRVLLVDEDFDNPSHPWHERLRGRRARHGHQFDDVDPDVVAASLSRAGFPTARGSHTTIAGRPVKLVRATR